MASNQPKALDLEEAVTTWAWREYDRTATKKQRQLKQKQEKKGTKIIDMHIDWSGVQFHDQTRWAPLQVGLRRVFETNDKRIWTGSRPRGIGVRGNNRRGARCPMVRALEQRTTGLGFDSLNWS
jgi:hypothetical protein